MGKQKLNNKFLGIMEDCTGDFQSVELIIVVSTTLSTSTKRQNGDSHCMSTSTAAAIGVKLELLDIPPVNQLTWQEVVRRYIKAHLLVNGRTVSENNIGIELFQCLQGDGGICCKSQASVAGLDLDAKLLGRAIENVFGELTKRQNGDSHGVCIDDVLP